MRIPWLVLAMTAGCSSGGDGSSDAATDDGATPVPPAGTPCVPDDAAGTTWDEVGGHFLAINKVVDYQFGEFEGFSTRYYVPETTPVGLAMPFHGAGGKTGTSDYIEWDPLFNELIQAGWAVAATESEDSTWSFGDGLDNPDTARILRWLDELAETTALEFDTPLLPIGFSAGGNMVPRFMGGALEDGRVVPAGLSHNSGASGDRQGLPFLWVSSVNDYDKDGNNFEDARANYESHIASGAEGKLIETPEIPYHPMRMMRNKSYDAAESQAVFDEMVTLGLIDAAGTRIPSIEGHEQVLEDYLTQSVLPGPERVPEQIRVVWATHRYNGINAIEECEWIMDHY